MRTLVFVLAGFVALALFMAAARQLGGSRASVYQASFWLFALAWAAVAAVNLWIGVTRAGYTVVEELPIFAVIVLPPVIVGYFVQRRLQRTAQESVPTRPT